MLARCERPRQCDFVGKLTISRGCPNVTVDQDLTHFRPESARSALIQALDAGDDVTWAAGGAWRADGEDLAEGEVETWLWGMAPA